MLHLGGGEVLPIRCSHQILLDTLSYLETYFIWIPLTGIWVLLAVTPSIFCDFYHNVPQGGQYFIAHFPIWCLIATDVMLNFYITSDILTLYFISILFPIIKNWDFLGYLV